MSLSVKFIDNRTKATQISQFELTLCKDGDWKIANRNMYVFLNLFLLTKVSLNAIIRITYMRMYRR